MNVVLMDALLMDPVTAPWGGHDTRLMLVALAGIAIIVALIVLARMHPFLALVLGSAFVGLASGVGSGKVITNFEQGVGGQERCRGRWPWSR